MQDKKMTVMLIPVSVDDIEESGIDLDGVIQITAENGRIIIENPSDTDDFVCGGDCESCPLSDADCDGNCEGCPCCEHCDESEA